jgi:hypothetical protein
VPLVARNRLAVAEGHGGSLAVFPPPHQFFFAREIEVNNGFVWYRKNDERTFSLGVRQGDTAGGYNPTWIEQVYALYNAPPGTLQRMAVYFYLSPTNAGVTRDAVLSYTHGDRFRPLPGYQVMATHFHTAFTEELTNAASLDVQPPWISAIRALGVNIVMIDDFHGDGHPEDTGQLRLEELRHYYCQGSHCPTFLCPSKIEGWLRIKKYGGFLAPDPLSELDSSFRLQCAFAKDPRAVRQGMFSLDFTAIYSEPEGSGAHAHKRSSFREVHPALSSCFVAAVSRNVMMTAQGGYSFASPAVSSSCEHSISVQ